MSVLAKRKNCVDQKDELKKSVKKIDLHDHNYTSKEKFTDNDDIEKDPTNNLEGRKFSEGRTKTVHLRLDEVHQRIQELEEKVSEYREKPEFAKKRKRVYQQLAKLKRALENPQEMIVDPDEEFKRMQMEKEKRIAKKLQKAEQLKLEKKREKNRAKHVVCILCKTEGHLAKNCTRAKENPKTLEQLTKNMCFNCGRNDHRLKDCPKPQGETLKFAVCFFCKKKGHLSRDCPQNLDGIYHKGGSCFECGSKRHLAKECPHRGTREIIQNINDDDKNNQEDQVEDENNQEIFSDDE